nr:hypothetical protein [Tanacetum cinerariifolium]
MSSSDSTVTYTSVSSEDVPFWGIRFFGMEQPDSPEAAPQSPIQTPPEQPLPPVVLPTAESPEYVAKSDPKEDPEEYEDEEIEDGPFDYPIDEGDDDNGDSSRDDADDEEEEHLAPADSAIVTPTDELVSPPEGTEPVIPPPSTDTTTTGARIIVRLQAAISFPPEAETLRLAFTHALIDAVTAAISSPPLPPPLYIPPPVDRIDDILEIEMQPRKRLCLSTLGSRYEIEDSSTARPTEDRGIDFGFVSTLDAKARRRGIGEVGVTELDELHEHDTQDLYALLEDAQDSRARISQRVAMDSQRVDLLMEDRIAHQKTIQIVEEEAYAAREAWAHSIGLSQAVHSELQTHQECQAQMVKTLRVMGDMRREMGDMQAELLALREQPRRARQPKKDARVPDHQDAPRDADKFIQVMIDQALLQNSTNRDGSHSSHKDNRQNVQTARLCFYADFMKCQPLNFKGTEGMVKFATCTLLDVALTWWNSQIRSLGPDAYLMTWEVLKKKMTDKYCPQGEIKKLEIELWNLKKINKYVSGLPDNIYGSVKASKPNTLYETIELANDLMDQKLRTYTERQTNNKSKAEDSFRNNHGHQQPLKRQNVAKVYNMGMGKKKPYSGNLPKCTKCHFHHNGPCTQKCHNCNKVGYFARDCRSSGNANIANAPYKAYYFREQKDEGSLTEDNNHLTIDHAKNLYTYRYQL